MQLLAKLARSIERGVKMDLSRMQELCRLHGEPQRSFTCIHVGGTNGKGSVSLKIATALQRSGKRTGLYTSPHLTSYRERIVVDGSLIEEEELVQLLEQIDADRLSATFFEVMTLLAFLYFRKKQVEYAVIEVGLGGRLDATNVIDPCLNVITSIDFDHQEILGSTLEQIAKEKAGIIKPGVPVVLGRNTHPILHRIAKERGASVFEPSAYEEGFYDFENQAIAEAALRVLGVEAVESVRPKCRFELVQENMILDVAHNPAGFKRCFEALQFFYPGQKLHLLVGMAQDKDVEGSMRIAKERAASILAVPCEGTRGIDPKELSSCYYSTIEEGMRALLQKDGLRVALGSFMIMRGVRSYLGLL